MAITARDRAAGVGESALDTLSDFAETARERFGAFGDGSSRQAGSAIDSVESFAGTAATLLAGAPRLAAQLRGRADDGYPYAGRDDWRKYGEVFSR